MEIWKKVVGWEDLYEVSVLGGVRSLDRTICVLDPKGRMRERKYRGRRLKPTRTKNGYPQVNFTAPDRKREYAYVHDLVLAAFVGPKPLALECCHGDGSRDNNALANLRYGTRSENSLDRHVHGTVVDLSGMKNANAKLSGIAIQYILQNQGRLSQRKMGERLGVSHNTIGAVLRGERYSAELAALSSSAI